MLQVEMVYPPDRGCVEHSTHMYIQIWYILYASEAYRWKVYNINNVSHTRCIPTCRPEKKTFTTVWMYIYIHCKAIYTSVNGLLTRAKNKSIFFFYILAGLQCYLYMRANVARDLDMYSIRKKKRSFLRVKDIAHIRKKGQ